MWEALILTYLIVCYFCTFYEFYKKCIFFDFNFQKIKILQQTRTIRHQSQKPQKYV